MLDRRERLGLFRARLLAAPASSNADTAKALIDSTLNDIEEEFSGVPFAPDTGGMDGRMYPAQEDSRILYAEDPSLRVYRHKGHITYIGVDGAILIVSLRDNSVFVSCPGANGETIAI